MLGQRYLYDAKSVLDLRPRQIESVARFETELREGIGNYKYESYTCECGATDNDFDILAEKDRYGLKSRTVICRKCGLVMTNPRMTQESYDYFYDKEYGRLYRNHDQMDDEYFQKRVLHGETIYNYILETSNIEFHDVLEIGCAAGGILQYFKQQGCEVTGVDLGSEYIEFGQKKGLDLRQCHSKELLGNGKQNSYDLIILNHVLEHFLTFETEFDVISQLLSANGILYIEVPGIKNLVNSYRNDFLRYLQNAHVYNFTLGTLEQVMNKYGFSLVAGNEIIRSLWRYTGDRKEISKNYFTELMSFLYQLEYHRELQESKQ